MHGPVVRTRRCKQKTAFRSLNAELFRRNPATLKLRLTTFVASPTALDAQIDLRDVNMKPHENYPTIH